MSKEKPGEKTFFHATKPIKPVNRLAAIVTSKTSKPPKAIPLNLEYLNEILDKLVAATNDNNKVVRRMKPEDADEFSKKCTSARNSCYQILRNIYAVNYKNYNELIAARLEEVIGSARTPLPDDFIKFVARLR